MTVGRVRLEIGKWRHEHVPRFRALLAGGKTPTSCLILYYEHTVPTMLLELSCLEEEED
jgi:hypothetical protein